MERLLINTIRLERFFSEDFVSGLKLLSVAIFSFGGK